MNAFENSNYKNLKIYQTIKENGGWNNWQLVQVEKYPCEDSEQAKMRERYWFEILQNEVRTEDEAKEQKKFNRKQYYLEHATQKKAYQRQYEAKNADKIKAYRKQYKKDHIEENKAYWKQYYLEHAEKLKQNQKILEQKHVNT
jgi:hypothetical protein